MFPRVQDCVYPLCLKLLWQAGMVSRVHFLRHLLSFLKSYFHFSLSYVRLPIDIEVSNISSMVSSRISSFSII
jgi:hypothetical protein